MKFSKLKFFLGGLCALVLTGALLSCVVDDKDDDKDDTTEFSVKVTPESTEIASSGSVDLSAVVTVVSAKNNSPEIKWEITGDSEYAELSAKTGERVTLTGKNTKAENKSVTVKATAAVDGIAKTAAATITVTGTGSSSGGEGGGTGGSGESGGTGGSGESGGSESGETILWRADDYTAETISETKVLGNMTVLASSSKQVTIASSSITVEGYSFTKVLKFGGSGSKTGRALKFTLTETSELEVYCVSASNSGTGRMLVLATDSAEINKTNEAPTTAGILNYGSIEAGTYYLYSNNSGINIYAVKITTAGTGTGEPTVSSVKLSSSSVSLITGSSMSITATVNGSNLSDKTVTWKSTDISVATVTDGKITAVGAGTAIITASANADSSKTASCTVTVVSDTSKVIRASDVPDGWAGIEGGSSFGGYGASSSNIYTVSDYAGFINALKCGGSSYSSTKKIIYVNGEIDLNGGKTPYDYIVEAGKGSTYASYEAWKEAFLKTCIKDTASTLASDQSAFHNKQKAQAVIMVPANTTIIGITDDAGFKNGTLYLKGVSNVVIRNLTVWDSLDYFPPWYQSSENNFNADMDCISVEGSTYVWIDHCTLGDSAHVYDKVETPVGTLDWVNYDALCDITKGANYVTVSNCQFLNDDKVGLVGSTDNGTTYGDSDKLKVTFHHNYYNNVGQRLPRVRFGQVHVYNNNYDKVSSCCVVVGKSAQIYVENNYFSANSSRAFDVKDSSAGVTSVGNKFVTTSSTTATGIDANWKPSEVTNYVYSVDEAENVPNLVNATTVGAGVWNVVQ
ncbi:Ig-like domain-containing protein [Treponema berlinense]|uniref:pectate lyase family protein n=1 Tax=Treponema berlinense TaxID=225004 RepID=UPI0026E9ED5C|nr:Ig-like domain-containing protein [Treponema berlinense]